MPQAADFTVSHGDINWFLVGEWLSTVAFRMTISSPPYK
jgi:hypothetical protein